MFRLIGTNATVELWSVDYEVPVQLQNELLKLSDGMHMFAVGDVVLGWGYTVLIDDERCETADGAAMRTLEDRYLDVKRVSPVSRKSAGQAITYH